jgi:glycolate oxidase
MKRVAPIAKLTPRLTGELQKLLPSGEISLQPDILRAHAGDKWFASALPEAVALPRSTASVSKLLAFANRHNIPVTARGAGHGYVGGCVPICGGIVLSTARMNRVKEVSATDFVAVVEPSVITAKLQAQVEKRGLFYPPDPASRADNSIGGNIATNAGGPRCLKYGVTRDYVLGLEVVLANGDVVRLGGRTHKNKTGFDLHRLFVGSEGMLGIVTEATLRLLPLPPYRANLAAGFATMRDALAALQAIFAAGFLPCALEVADEFTLAAAAKRTGSARLRGCKAHLIAELDGHKRSVLGEVRDVERVIRGHRPLFVERGEGAEECEAVWKLRREFSYALRDTGLTKLNEDIVVPRGKLQQFFRLTAQLQRKHGLPIACFGHAGDGNIHANVMVDTKDSGAKQRSEACLDEFFQQIIRWGGSITGEHGIGLAKKRWWPQALSIEARQLHQVVKRALDPAGILNPGKFL